MKKLSDILYGVKLAAVNGSTDVDIAGVQIDSRKVESGTLFIAVKGSASDGHQFIGKAIELGATAIVCETLPTQMQASVTFVQVTNSAEAAGRIAHAFYDMPSQKLKLVGVTGTNGKTTIATLLFQLFTGLGYKCLLLF